MTKIHNYAKQFKGGKTAFSPTSTGANKYKWGGGGGFDLILTHNTKINSKWVMNLNAKHKTVKLLGKTIGENL